MATTEPIDDLVPLGSMMNAITVSAPYARVLANATELEDDRVPRLENMSAAFFFRGLPVQRELPPYEYVHAPMRHRRRGELRLEEARLHSAIAQWNLLWEAGSARADLLASDFPAELQWLSERSDANLFLLPDDGPNRYAAYEPLYHLVPPRTLQRFGLPVLRRGLWPNLGMLDDVYDVLPRDFEPRLSRAVASHLWPLLDPRGSIQAFSQDDPIHLLAHSLDFWRPHIDAVIQQRLRAFSRVEVESEAERQWLGELTAACPSGFVAAKPLKGGDVWSGQDDAWDATQELVEVADSRGRLRAVLDAVRSHRADDDFGPRWSWAKEDFERALHHKRNKVKVTFVELDDTIPVHGPDAQVEANEILGQLLTLCDRKERRVLVCMRSGVTRIGDVARELGYKNHSPVSKAFARIQAKAAKLLGVDAPVERGSAMRRSATRRTGPSSR
jgi:hypothetical protein